MGKPSWRRVTELAASSREDRLTEIAAMTFRLSPNLARAFVGEALLNDITKNLADIEVEGTTFEIVPQLHVQGATKALYIDLAFENESLKVWIEAKLDAELHDGQLADYYSSLTKSLSSGERGLLIFLPREGLADGAVGELWNNVKDAQESRVGIAAYDWTKLRDLGRGTEPLEIAEGRAIQEFVRYLEESRATVPPLHRSSTKVISEIPGTLDSLWNLLENVTGQIFETEKKEIHKRPTNRRWAEAPRYEIRYRLDADESKSEMFFEWNFDVRSTDWPNGPDPSFAWGLKTISQTPDWPHSDLQDALSEFHQGTDDGHSFLFRTKSLDELFDTGMGSNENLAGTIAQEIEAGLEECRRAAQKPSETETSAGTTDLPPAEELQ